MVSANRNQREYDKFIAGQDSNGAAITAQAVVVVPASDGTPAAVTFDTTGTVLQATTEAIGNAQDNAWNGVAQAPSLVALLKRIALVGNKPSSSRVAYLHRDAITAADKLAVPAAVTAADVATGGVLLAGSTYKVTVAAYNKWGATTVPTPGSVAMAADASNTHVARLTVAQVSYADGYDVFVSTDANPLWVARITEAQRAAGCTVTAVGTVTATTPGAGLVDVRVVGTGLASNVNPFAVNNAYIANNVGTIPCTGYTKARVLVKLAVTDLRSLPTLVLTPFYLNSTSGDKHQVTNQTITLLTAVGQPLEQEFALTVDGAAGLSILVDAITGQGAAASVWVELA